MNGVRILAVRLGAMGDVIAALPAVASLKHSIPHSRITWAIESKWSVLLEGNPYVDAVLPVERRTLAGLRSAWQDLRSAHIGVAVDFQGLIKSALVATIARPERIFGFDTPFVRERAATWFYSSKVQLRTAHVVDRNLELASAAGATSILRTFPLPPGEPEGRLPEGNFVLASPLAGWGAKQWPLEAYSELARRLDKELGLPLVLNGPQRIEAAGCQTHVSGIRGLIHATRRASAVIGVDSGPVHLAAALGKPGVAIFGPTDPARNGPYGGTFTVLRSSDSETTYKRTAQPAASMLAITPEQVFAALDTTLHAGRHMHADGRG